MGERRIGVAISDPCRVLASPLEVISGAEVEAAIDTILGIAAQHEVRCIVVGMPYSLDGGIGPQAKRVQEFVRRLSGRSGIPVDTWDERLSTVAARRMMSEGGTRRGRRDAVAAALILQGYLDRHFPQQGR